MVSQIFQMAHFVGFGSSFLGLVSMVPVDVYCGSSVKLFYSKPSIQIDVLKNCNGFIHNKKPIPSPDVRTLSFDN